MASPERAILVVDDDASIRFLCRVNLELEGWTVREAATVAEAREALAAGEISVVLLDAHLGTESGVELLKEIRRDHAGTRVAMLTGTAGADVFEGTEPDAVIPKPFKLDDLSGTVRRLAG